MCTIVSCVSALWFSLLATAACIPVIAIVPDLDDDEKNTEDITKQVANAPKNVQRKVQTLTELDQESHFQVKGATVRARCVLSRLVVRVHGSRLFPCTCHVQSGVDLGLLTACLSSAEAVRPALCLLLLLSCAEIYCMRGSWRGCVQVQEEDEPWEFDSLLQEVSQAMQADIDKQEADEKDY